MQINFDAYDRAANSPGFLNWVSLDSELRAVDTAACYAPYGTPGYTFGFPGYSAYKNADIVYGGFGNPSNYTPLTQLPLPDIHSVTAGLSGVGDAPPAATPSDATASPLPLGPVSLVSPLPSITPATPDKVSSVAVVDTCPISNWVANNPGLAAVGAIGIFLLFGGKKK